jgi:MerR family transcriptional regulator, light-induced transcriptional regulator
MRTLKTAEAASLLNVSPNTLRAWERRFGYPRPSRSAGRHRLYPYAEIDALRQALRDGLAVSSAVSVAKESLTTDVGALVASLVGFKRGPADHAMEAALALTPLDRAVEELLLPAVDEVARRKGLASAAWAFASRWAIDWLRRLQRLSAPSERPLTVLLANASQPPFDPAGPYIAAFELSCERAGANVLSLPVTSVGGLPDAAVTLRARGVIIAGSAAERDAVTRWLYAVRSAVGPLPVAFFRRERDTTWAASSSAKWLDSSPEEARRELFDLIEASDSNGTRPAPASGRERAAALALRKARLPEVLPRASG